jgi:hypothetical protein
MNTKQFSRRRLLAGVPAVVATTVPVAATALSGFPAEPDPIFGLIAEHREAIRAESAAYRMQSDAEETIPREQRKSWSYRAGDEGPPEGCTDAPEWIAAMMAVMNACDRQCDAEVAVLTTPPATFAGVVALLEHVSLPSFPEEAEESDASDGLTILENAGVCYREDVSNAAEAFPAMIAAALRKLLPA